MESFEQWNEAAGDMQPGQNSGYYGGDPGQKDLSGWAKANWRRQGVKTPDNVPGEQPRSHENEDLITQLDAYSVSEQQALVEMIIGSTPWLYSYNRTLPDKLGDFHLVHKCHVFNVLKAKEPFRPEQKILVPPYKEPSIRRKNNSRDDQLWGENLEVDVVFDILDVHKGLPEEAKRIDELEQLGWIRRRKDGLLMMVFGLEREVAYRIHTRSLVQWSQKSPGEDQ